MKNPFADTVLTRSIVLVVAALAIAHIVAIVSFKLIAENMFAAMQRYALAEVSMQVLELAGSSSNAEDFSQTVTQLDGVLFVQSSDRAHVVSDNIIGMDIRQKWARTGQSRGAVLEFRIGDALRPPPEPGPVGLDGPRPPWPDADRPPPPRHLRDAEPGPGPGFPPPDRPLGFGGDLGFPPTRAMISVGFGENNWENVLVSGHLRVGPPIQPFIFVSLLTLIAVAVAAAFAARWIYKPLNQLAEASAVLGRGEKHSPLPVSGPRDIRNLMQAFNTMAAQLETTIQSQKNVLVAIGHDLRTPLTALRIRTAMIEDETERQKMDRALDQLQSLTEAALRAGTQSLRTDTKETVELGALIQSLCDDLRDIGLPVACHETPGQLLVEGWPEDLTRALRNIIENAVRYGGQARIRLFEQDGYCRIEIEDDGLGISEQDMEAVFEPLVRLEKSRSEDTGGHGLGLHIARNIVLAHGGRIDLKNADGGGLRVIIVLPGRPG